MWGQRRSKDAENYMIEKQEGLGGRQAVKRVHCAAVQKISAVYFLAAVGSGFVKIGTLTDGAKISRRIDLLQTGCPFALRLGFMLHGAGRAEESKLHKRFAEQHQRGEWYRREGALDAFLTHAEVEPEEAARKMMTSLHKFVD